MQANNWKKNNNNNHTNPTMAQTVLVAGHANKDVVDGPLRPVVAVWYMALVPAEPQRTATFVIFLYICRQARKVIYPGRGSIPRPLLASLVLYQLSYPSRQFCLRFVPIHHSELTVPRTHAPGWNLPSNFFDILLHQTWSKSMTCVGPAKLAVCRQARKLIYPGQGSKPQPPAC